MKIIKHEIQFEESLKQRLEFICEFSHVFCDFCENILIFRKNHGINILSGAQETFEALSHFLYLFGGIMKEYKNNKELINYLISKNVIVNDKEKALKNIEKYSYYSIINGYKAVF